MSNVRMRDSASAAGDCYLLFVSFPEITNIRPDR